MATLLSHPSYLSPTSTSSLINPIRFTCSNSIISISKSHFFPFLSNYRSNSINLTPSKTHNTFICSSSSTVSTSNTNYEVLFLLIITFFGFQCLINFSVNRYCFHYLRLKSKLMHFRACLVVVVRNGKKLKET